MSVEYVVTAASHAVFDDLIGLRFGVSVCLSTFPAIPTGRSNHANARAFLGRLGA